MTIDEFVRLLAVTKGPWLLYPPMHPHYEDRIRRNERQDDWRFCCPLTALGDGRHTMHYMKDAAMLGLSEEDGERIAVTADGMITHRLYDPELRKRLLRATVDRDSARNAA